jgi:hypothetical protein
MPDMGPNHNHEDLFFHEEFSLLFDEKPSAGKKSS